MATELKKRRNRYKAFRAIIIEADVNELLVFQADIEHELQQLANQHREVVSDGKESS